MFITSFEEQNITYRSCSNLRIHIITMNHLAYLIARMVIDFSLNPELEGNFTAQGRLYYAGINSMQMQAELYRKTWKPYENLMCLALESAIDEASQAIQKYKKNTYKEMRA